MGVVVSKPDFAESNINKFVPKLKPLKIQTFETSDVIADNHVKFNTNNIWKDGKKPLDYDYIVEERLSTNVWVDRFHFDQIEHKPDYYTLDIEPSDLKWMMQAQKLGSYTGTFSALYQDELETAVKKYSQRFNIPEGKKWFIRTELVSLKNGQFGAGPYFGKDDLERVFKSMCSSTAGHTAIPTTKLDEKLRLYFFPWVEFEKDLEFRGFVYKNELTCLSVQHLYSPNDWCQRMAEQNKLESEIRKIQRLFYENIASKLQDLENYVVDMVLLNNGKLYFIETNCFGMEYAAGSALYEWSKDYDLMYGNCDYFEFRYVV